MRKTLSQNNAPKKGSHGGSRDFPLRRPMTSTGRGAPWPKLFYGTVQRALCACFASPLPAPTRWPRCFHLHEPNCRTSRTVNEAGITYSATAVRPARMTE